jgi:hypothetical protein
MVQLSDRCPTHTASRCNFIKFVFAFFYIRIQYIVSLSNLTENIIVVLELSIVPQLNIWFNPHRFWTARYISIRSIGPTYGTNQPSVR